MNLRVSVITLFLLVSFITASAQYKVDTIYPVSINEVTNDTTREDIVCILSGNNTDCVKPYKMHAAENTISGKRKGRDTYINVSFNQPTKKVGKNDMRVYSTPKENAILEDLMIVYHSKVPLRIKSEDLTVIKDKYLSKLDKDEDYYVVVNGYSSTKFINKDYIHLLYVQNNLKLEFIFAMGYSDKYYTVEYCVFSESVSS